MNQSYTVAERKHIEAVRSLPCSVCDRPGPSEAHHIDQHCAWTCVALCKMCHTDDRNGWHGRRIMWRLKKMEPIDALGVTIRRLFS